MHVRRIAITLGALALSLGLAGSANAAAFVEVDYDLKESSTGEGGTVLLATTSDFTNEQQSNPVNIIDGDMTVTYNGDTTIHPGMSVTIQSLKLAWNGAIYRAVGNYGSVTPRQTFGATSFDSVPGGIRKLASWTHQTFAGGFEGITLELTTPVQGQLTAGGLLTATGANVFFVALPQVNPRGTFEDNYPGVTVPINIAVPVGSYGGKHWVDGRKATTTVTTVGGATAGGGYLNGTGTLYNGSLAAPVHSFSTGQNAYNVAVPKEVTLVGREINREVVPEPGSLLLLGSGLAGLAALGTTGTVGLRRRRRG